MIHSDPPPALVLLLQGNELYDSGNFSRAREVLQQARTLAEGLAGDPFGKELLGRIDQQLSRCPER